MKKFNLSQTRFAWFLEKEHLFFCVALLAAGVAIALSPFYWSIFLVELIMTVVLWFVLFGLASEAFYDHYLAIGWALITFSLAYGFAAHYAFVDEYEIKHVGLSILWAGFWSSGVYAIAPKISSITGLSKEKAGFNSPIWIFILYGVIAFFFGVSESNDKEEIELQIEWEQTPFEPVASWQVEVWDAGTVYLITAKEGTFFVYPYHCPKIRQINKNTQVRVIFDRETYSRGGARKPLRLEIKN